MRTIIFSFLLLSFIPAVLHAGETKNDQCMYIPKGTIDNPSPELATFEDCGSTNADGRFVIKSRHLKQIYFPEEGPACIYTPGPKVFYLLEDGKSVEAQYVDNGCDYFSEGVARGTANGEKVYLNKKLEIVIETPYESIFPFRNGYAAVCNGSYEVQEGEHISIKGGECGYIDHTGKIVVPLKYTFESLPPR